MRRYDALVIGGGMAGLPLALRAGRHGSVALVERELLGGTCLNRGCIPTKTMIASAALAHQARRAADLGVTVGDVSVDLPMIVDRKDQVVEGIRGGSYRAIEQAERVDLHEGEGAFVQGRRFHVGDTTIEADRVFLNVGTRPYVPPIDGLDRVDWLDSTRMLALKQLPDHLVVIGGGYVGCEFAQMFARYGARVTIVQRDDRLLPAEEPEVSQAVLDGFVGDGIEVVLGTGCTAVDQADGGRIAVACAGDESSELDASHLLVAAGRVPNTDRLHLQHLDLEPDERGFVPVDGQLHTGVEDVWALGDVRGGPMFTHTARHDADVLYRSLYRSQHDRTIDGRTVPHGVFVDPEVGSVGLTEQQARDRGHEVGIGVQEFSGVARARATGETRGMIKFVVDAGTDRILGCHIAGPNGAELVHEAVIAMTADVPYRSVGGAIHIHPTLAEGVNSAAGGVHRPSA
ncbi:mercuric reductase [soil metagenome]